MKTVIRGVRLPEEVAEILKEHSEETGVSIARISRLILGDAALSLKNGKTPKCLRNIGNPFAGAI